MNLTIVGDTTPDLEPISLQEAKTYLRLDTSLDDGTIQGLISAARLEAENEQGRECAQKQFILAMDRFPWAGCSGEFNVELRSNFGSRFFPFGWNGQFIQLLDPLVSVDSFVYFDSANTQHTLQPNVDYAVDTLKHPGVICPMPNTQWPTADLWPSSAVQITFTAGFSPITCPWNVKQGIALLVSQWYEGRIPFEAIRFIAELPFSVTSLFRNNKSWKF